MLHICNSVAYLFFGAVFSLILSATMSVSIFWNTAANFGLLFCMRLLLASAMSRASMMIWISSALSWYIVLSSCAGLHGAYYAHLKGECNNA